MAMKVALISNNERVGSITIPGDNILDVILYQLNIGMSGMCMLSDTTHTDVDIYLTVDDITTHTW